MRVARRPITPERLVRISAACADAIAADPGAVPSVASLAAAAGISERSFYRYFPTKEECLRPLFDDGNRAFARALAARPAESGLVAALHGVFVEVFPDELESRSRAIMSAVIADPSLRRVWLEASYDTVHLIRPTVAGLLGRPDGSVAVTAACWSAVAFVMAAVEHLVAEGSHPSELADELAGSLPETVRDRMPSQHERMES